MNPTPPMTPNVTSVTSPRKPSALRWPRSSQREMEENDRPVRTKRRQIGEKLVSYQVGDLSCANCDGNLQ